MPLGKNADAGDYVKDFQKSDAPQFKGKSKEKRRKMAIAAYLDSKEKKESKMKSFSDIRAQISEQRTAADCAGMVCKNCGDVYGQPTEGSCMYDSKDPNGKNWVEKVEEAKVNEISPATKKSYINKAAADIDNRSYAQGTVDATNTKYNGKNNRKIANRLKGIRRATKEAKQTHMFDNEKDARAKAKEIGGKYVKGTGKSAGKHAAIKEGAFTKKAVETGKVKTGPSKDRMSAMQKQDDDRPTLRKNEGKKMDSAAMKKAMDAFKKRGGKIKKVAPGKAAGYHGKDDPGQDVQGMMDRGDTKGMPRKKKIRSMR